MRNIVEHLKTLKFRASKKKVVKTLSKTEYTAEIEKHSKSI